MGAVYEGEQPLGSVKRRVAVKTLHPHLSRDPKVQARFEREVATISELEHPNTIQVYDFGSTPDGILYFVMEFLHGGSVADRLAAEGAMAPPRASHIVEQVCGSLEEAHGRGIVHRDLKPDNVVLIDRAGHKDFVKVLDFGIAKRTSAPDSEESRLTQQGMVVGTPPYMSPEQFAGRDVDARSDIYSLGVMAYEMLTGKLPFKANTAWEWAAQHLTSPPIPIESLVEGQRVPQPMRDAIRRALAKSPDERFQTVGSFVEAFSGAAAASSPDFLGETVSVRKTELAPPIGVARTVGDLAPQVGGAPPLGGVSAPVAAATPVGIRAPGGGAGAGDRSSPAAGPTPTTAGNMAFPTPPALAEARPVKPGGRRGLLLAVAGVIVTSSAVAIALVARGGALHDASRSPVTSQPQPAAPPVTSLAPADLNLGEPTGPAPSSDLPPLASPGEKVSHSGPRAVSSASPASNASGPTPHGPIPTEATQAPPATAPPYPSLEALPPKQKEEKDEGASFSPAGASAQPGASNASAKYDGPECQKARVLRAFGRNREARSWTLACLAKGGSL